METAYASLPDIVISAGQQYSQIFNGVYAYHDAVQLMFYGSGSYGAETYTVEVNQLQNALSTDTGWVTAKMLDNTTNVAMPAAGENRHYGIELVGAGSFRVKASANVAAERRWRANKLWSWMSEK